MPELRASEARLDAREKLRVFVFCVVLGALVLVPIGALFLPEGRASHVGWRMFRVTATDFCVVRYEDHATGETLDHLALLGHPDPNTAPANLFRVRDAESARWYGRAVCSATEGARDVRMYVRCATTDGYDVVERGEKNACE